MTLSAQRRRDASDDAFRAVLQVDPRHVMSADAFSPTFRQRFDKLRAELARARKVRLSVQSQPAGATVYVDGFALGHTPANLDLVPGRTRSSWAGRCLTPSRTWCSSGRRPRSASTSASSRPSRPRASVPPAASRRARDAARQCPEAGAAARGRPAGDSPARSTRRRAELAVRGGSQRPDRAADPRGRNPARHGKERRRRSRRAGPLRGHRRDRRARGGRESLHRPGLGARTSPAGGGHPGTAELDQDLADSHRHRADRDRRGGARPWSRLSAQGERLRVEVQPGVLGGSAPLPSQVGTVDGYRSDAHTQQTLAYVGYAVGAVALGTGLWLWLTDGKAPATTVVAGPGSVAVGGRF